jgi:diguanylate cyclase (GGDEF)-like protein/PAS domain S-box-containing protein
VDFAIAEHEMVYDKSGNPIDYRYLYVNQPFCDLMSRTKDELVGRLAYQVFPKIEKTWLSTYQRVLETEEPTSFTNFTKEVNRYFNIYAVKTGQNRFLTSFRDVTAYMVGTDETEQLKMMAGLMNTAPVAYFEFDLKRKTFEYSPLLRDMIGRELITYEDYLSLFSDYIHPGDKERFDLAVKDVFNGSSNQLSMQIRVKNERTKEYKWLSFFVFVDAFYRHVPIKLRGLVKDIDKEQRITQERVEIDRLFQEARKIASIATFYFDVSTNKFRWSKELDEFTGISQLRDIDQMRDIVHPDDLDVYDYSTREIVNRPEGMVTKFRIEKNGQTRYLQSSIFPDQSQSGEIQYVFGILSDMTDQEYARQEVEYLANHDVLTGLFNRHNFEQTADSLDTKHPVTIMICDVDGLKLINDAFGHYDGDTLLQHLADIFRSVKNDHHIYRIGGDEFALLFFEMNDDKIVKIQEQIKTEVKKFRIYGVGFDVSIGFSNVDDFDSFEQAFRTAENIMYRRKLTQRKSRKSTALDTIMQTMHERTEETEEHCHRVAQMSIALLQAVGHKREYELEEMRLVANFHDIGKISISDTILMKPSALTKDEYEQIKYHSESGYKIISNIIENEDIAVAILYHHERWDGTGYPHGIDHEDIPLYSRIVAICDAYDAMTTDRVYQPAKTKKDALEELIRYRGTQFDPTLVDFFLELIQKW